MIAKPIKSDRPKDPTFKPALALAFSEVSTGSELTVTMHPIRHQRLMPGKPVSLDSALKQITMLKGGAQKEPSLTEALLNPKVLVSTQHYLIWHSSDFVKTMWFRGSLNTRIPNCHYPSLVYVYNRKLRNLRVFAKATNSRPTLNTRLYVAPLMNIGAKGDVCQGSAPLPTKTLDDNAMMEACEATLFESNFTHVNHSKTFSGKGDISSKAHVHKWQALAKAGKKPSARDMRFFAPFSALLNQLR